MKIGELWTLTTCRLTRVVTKNWKRKYWNKSADVSVASRVEGGGAWNSSGKLLYTTYYMRTTARFWYGWIIMRTLKYFYITEFQTWNTWAIGKLSFNSTFIISYFQKSIKINLLNFDIIVPSPSNKKITIQTSQHLVTRTRFTLYKFSRNSRGFKQ